MPYDARVVANRFIQLAREQGRPLTPMQINKLTYIAHGWVLALCQRPLLSQHVLAWRYGPVLPDIYHALKRYRDQPVTSEIVVPSETMGAQEEHIIKEVSRVYGGYNGVVLSHITHQPGTPWTITWQERGQNAIISNDLIAAHYKALAEQRRAG
jgi:uncharacterized phage-associated protein